MKKILLLLLIGLAFFACKDEPPADEPKDQSQTITFGANLSTNVTGHMTNSQWDNVIGKLTTALNAAANADGNLGSRTAAAFNAGVNIDLVKTTEYNYYKIDLPGYKIFLNADYVIGATQADLSSKIAAAINSAYGEGATQQ